MKRVLIIKSDPTHRRALSELLAMNGFSISSAENISKGFKLISEFVPDLILCDLQLITGDGFEFLEGIKNKSLSGNTPTIFLTRKANLYSKSKTLELGTMEYLIEPYKQKDLLSKINGHLYVDTMGSDSEQIRMPSLEQRFMRDFENVLQNHLSNPNLSLLVIAENMNMSTSSVQKKLKQITGNSVSGYTREYRLNIAQNLLTANLGSISDISQKTGV